MSDRNTPIRQQFYRLLTSKRARIPLAVVAVLLLGVAVSLVSVVETREEAQPTTDVDAAIDQTESVTQTAVRDGATRATTLAAEQPLTNVDGSTTYGTLLADRSDPFRAYLEVLIYRQVRQQLAGAGQQVAAVQTDVSLPPIEDPESFERAIDQVEVEPSPNDQNATIAVSVENVTISAIKNGNDIAQETATLNVSIVSPLFELHERVNAYERTLNGGLLEDPRGVGGPTFTQRFNARTYGIGYLRGLAQNYRAPVVEVLANRHIEPAVNDAVYRIQQDVFGTTDPSLQGAVQAGWACMLLKDGEVFIGESKYSPTAKGYLNSLDVDAETLCNVTEYVLDPDETIDFDAGDILEMAPGHDGQKETVEIGSKAALPLAHMANPTADKSFERVLERMFSASVSLNSTVVAGPPENRTAEFDDGCEKDASATTPRYSAVTIDESQVAVDNVDPANTGGRIYNVSVPVEATIQDGCRETESEETNTAARSTHTTVEYTINTTMEIQETNPAAAIDDINEDTDTRFEFERGPATHQRDRNGIRNFQNYGDGVVDGFVRNLLGRDIQQYALRTDGTTSLNATKTNCKPNEISSATDMQTTYACWLAAKLVDGEVIESTEGDGVERLSTRQTVSVDPRAHLGKESISNLVSMLYSDLDRVQNRVTDINYTFTRQGMVTGDDNPFDGLRAELRQRKRAELHTTEYANVAEKALYEARLYYFQLLDRQLEAFGDVYAESIAELDDKLDKFGDSADTYLDFMTAEQPEPKPGDTSMPSSPLTGEMTYEISASPTYLEPQNVTKADLPATDSSSTFTPLAIRNENSFDLPYDDVAEDMLQKIADLLPTWGDDSNVEQSLRMAGDLVKAAELAQTANDSSERIESDEEFDREVVELKSNVRNGLRDYEEQAAREIAKQLYDQEVAYCLYNSPDGFWEVMKERGVDMALTIGETFDTIKDVADNPWKAAAWSVNRMTDAADTVKQQFTELVEGLDPRNWFDGKEDEDLADRAANFSAAMQSDDPPFDPSKDGFRYGECSTVLAEIDEGYKGTIENATAEIETAVNDTIRDIESEDGVGTAAERIGRGNISEEVTENVLSRLDEQYIPDSWSVEPGDQWEQLLESAVGPGLERGAGIRIEIGNEELAETIDERLQGALGDVSEDIVANRSQFDLASNNLTNFTDAKLEANKRWVGNESFDSKRAARVPAGIPVLPLPGYWFATVNAWDIDVAGEYARFEVSANIGSPEEASGTTYVREEQPIEVEIDGKKRRLGSAEPIGFEGKSIVVIVVPPGVGVGDRSDENPECSPTYPETGYIDPSEISC